MTNVPPSRGGNELKGVVVSDHANYAPCPVTPRLMQEIEEQNQIVSWFVCLLHLQSWTRNGRPELTNLPLRGLL